MPIYLDRDLSSPRVDSAGHCIEIGLINNMPDAALRATEHQFIRLLDSVAAGVAVRLLFYALPDVPRAAAGRHHIGSFYSNIDTLWDRHLDAVIMTGCEPHASNLQDEPYWASMTRIIDWAEQNTHSAIWSCLAAHAVVLYRDGIARRRLNEKRSGIFPCDRIADHRLLAGVDAQISMPHSRWNDLPEDELTARGYRVLTRCEQAGVDMFVKQSNSLFVFFQGHPEYDANTLLHEYHRDLKRYRQGQTQTQPEMPQGRSNPNDRWRSAAQQIYRNWLTYLSEQRQEPQRKGPERQPAALHSAAGAD